MKRWSNHVLLAVLVLLLCLAPLAAQDEAAGPSSAKKPPETLIELIVAGGALNIVFMAALGLLSLSGLAVILERLVNLTGRKLMPPGFVSELQELVRRKETDAEKFRDLCKRHPSPVASILNAALLRVGRTLPEVEKSMEDAAARVMGGLRGRTRPLTVLANVSPLVGLLGTVVGMVMAFRTASQAGLGKAELLAEGIYLALETTVAGLVIAIPCQLFAAWFHSRTELYMRRMDELLIETIPCFAQMEKAGSEQTVKAEANSERTHAAAF